ncbi:MAG: hypothetical protein IPK26_15260 [Planctomycetes bacterium]|nr:hypothetical protein [Planctomycetota bacterium]
MRAWLPRMAGLAVVMVCSAAAFGFLMQEPVPSLPAPVGVVAPSAEALDQVYARANARIDATERILVGVDEVDEPRAPSVALGPNSVDAWTASRRVAKPSLPRYLLENRRLEIAAADLLRHRALNPRDVVLDGDRPAELERLIAPVLREIDAAMTLYHEAVALELDAMVAAGRKTPLVYKDDGPTRAFLARNPPTAGVHFFDPNLYVGGDKIDMFRCSGGTLFGFSNADAPRIRGLVDYLTFLRADLATRLARWFEGVGALTPVEASLFLEQVFTYRRGG